MASTVQQAISSALTGIKNLKRDWGGESSRKRRREQISPRFKRALEAEVRRLMELTPRKGPLIKEIVATERVGALEMSRRLKQLGFPTRVSGKRVFLTNYPIEKHKVMAVIERIQKGMDVSFMLKTTPGVKRYGPGLSKAGKMEAMEAQTWRVVVQAPGHKNKVKKVTVSLEDADRDDFEYEAEFQARLQVAKETGASIHKVKALSSRQLR
jgi:hypothetical protein